MNRQPPSRRLHTHAVKRGNQDSGDSGGMDSGRDEVLAQGAAGAHNPRSEETGAAAPTTDKLTARASRKGKERGAGLGQITSDRPIFTLSVAADLLGLHPRTLRIYEAKKLVAPARTGGNRRRYSQNDIRRFSDIRRLTQGGVNLEGVRIILEMSEELTRLGGDPNAIIERNLSLVMSDE